ncbi:hypothetical protein KY386_01245 [Candidatus Parcubacteria bacterium]|nr:hypothetical protein [Candidatus Parcubacteria bacterium]
MKKVVVRFRAADRPVFDAIKNGDKTVETRAATPRYRGVQVSDVLVMLCGADRLEKRVTSVHHFKDVSALLDEVDWRKIAPEVGSREAMLASYERWYGGKIDQLGLVAFGLA